MACLSLLMLWSAPVDARSLEAVIERGTLTLCASPNALPFASKNGPVRGFQVELGEKIAEQLGVATATVKTWKQAGFLSAHPYNDKNDCLFEPLGDDAPVKGKHKGLVATLRQVRHTGKVTPQHHDEVHYEN